jgi:hypothetical protein
MQNARVEADKKDRIADEIVEQGSVITPDEVHRQVRREDETKGDPNSRDAAGGPDPNETPHGREESKVDKPGAANVNG